MQPQALAEALQEALKEGRGEGHHLVAQTRVGSAGSELARLLASREPGAPHTHTRLGVLSRASTEEALELSSPLPTPTA